MASADEPPAQDSDSWWARWKGEWAKPAVVVAIVVAVVGGLWAYWINRTQEKPVVEAEQIRRCVKAHDLRRAVDEYWYRDDENQRIRDERSVPADSTHVFAFCEWPAPDYADPDGYSEIVASSEDGPQDTEASSASQVDRIFSPCPVLELHYYTQAQGQGAPLEPYEVGLGEVVWAVDGEPWEGDVLAGRDWPGPRREDEVVAVRNFSVSLDRAVCV